NICIYVSIFLYIFTFFFFVFLFFFFFFSSRRRHTRFSRDWSSDVCSSDLFLPSSKAKSPSLFCWNYSVAGTSTRFSIWCQGPEKPLRIPRGRRRRAGDSWRRRQRGPFRGSS